MGLHSVRAPSVQSKESIWLLVAEEQPLVACKREVVMSNKNERIGHISENGVDTKSEGGPVARNKATLFRFQEEVFDGHDWRLETLAKYLTLDFIDHTAGPNAEPGLEGVSHRFAQWHAAFGDAVKENIAVLGEGDMLAVLYNLHAWHRGEFMGIAPTNKKVVIPGIEIVRFRDGKIGEYWSIYDYLSTAAEINARLTLVPLTRDDGEADVSDQDVYRGIVYSDRKRATIRTSDLSMAPDNVARNKAALLGFQREVFNGHDWRVETLAKHLTPDFIDHAAGPHDMPGLEGVQSRFTVWQSAFDDAEEDNIAMVGEGPMLAVLYDLHAWHRGQFMGIGATNRKVVIPGIEMLRFREGKIAEHWGIYDFQSTASQIGAEFTFMPQIPASPGIFGDDEAAEDDVKVGDRREEAAAD